MKISRIEIRACCTKDRVIKASEMRQGTIQELNFLVVKMKTDDGLEAETFGFASASARLRIAADLIKPVS
jgi:hypothetical protein